MEWLLHTFCPLLPRTAFPERSWIGDRNGWTATDFLTRLINRLGADTSDDAAAALQRLLQAAPDGYTEHLQSVAMENAQLRVEADYLPPTVAGLAAIADDATPLSMGDLQAFMLEDIAIAQGKVISGDVDSWREFFDDAGEPDRFDSSLLVERGAARATSSAAPFGRAI